MTLTAVSLFAGIEGFGLAFERAGIRTVAAVEIDDAARGVIHDRFPDTALFTDVCEVTADDLRAAGFDPDRGVIAGGWPCQDLSVAGRRLGLGGARSGLVWEVVRLLRDLRSRWFVLENVPGLLSAVCSCPGLERCEGTWRRDPDLSQRVHVPCADPHPVRGGDCGRRTAGGRLVGDGRCMELHGGAMGAILGALGELGYGFAYRVLDAQHFGVPQRRRRVVIVGCLGDWAAPVEVLLEPEGGGGHSAAGRAAGQGVAAVAALSASGGGADDNDATGGRLIAGTLGSRVGGSRTTDLDGHGAYIAGPVLATGSGRGHRIDAEGAASGHLIAAAIRTANHHGDQAGAESHLVAATLTAGSHDTRAPGRRREDDENIVATVSSKWAKGTGGPAGDEAQNLIAFDTAQITSPENRVNPQPGDPSMPLVAGGQPHVAYALRTDPGGVGQAHNTTFVPLGGEGVRDALTAEGHDASEDGTGRGTPLVPVAFDWQTDGSERARPNVSTARTSSIATTKRDAVAVATAVRRLTPVECERLQGFPDNWTATSFGQPQSDSARYRELGNSIAVPVFAWGARRLVAVDARRFGGVR
jgi:site-specific DNA-cytosine methylase